MEEQCGIVIKVEGNYILVEADAVSFCASCNNHECSMRQSHGRQLWIENTLGAVKGDRVIFVLPSKGIILSSVVLYGVPILFLIAGIIAGTLMPLSVFSDSDVSGIIGGIVFFVLSFGIMRIASKYIVKHNKITPTMVKVEKLL